MASLDTTLPRLEAEERARARRLADAADASADPKHAARLREGKARHAIIMAKRKLKETLSTYLASMGSFFQLCDTNGDGTIDRHEFQQAVLALGLPGDFSERTLKRVADEVYEEFDVDGSNSISYHEFLRYVLRDAP